MPCLNLLITEKKMAFMSTIVSANIILKETLDIRAIQQAQLYSVLHESNPTASRNQACSEEVIKLDLLFY